VLLFGFGAGAELFRTGWFLESLLTELAVLLVLRTRRAAFRSRPGRLLAISTAVVAALAVAVPYLPFAGLLGFVPLPWHVLAALLAITAAYVATSELAKRALLPRVGRNAPARAFGKY
jgi:Mg2+-importing ATPase